LRRTIYSANAAISTIPTLDGSGTVAAPWGLAKSKPFAERMRGFEIGFPELSSTIAGAMTPVWRKSPSTKPLVGVPV
jgi:hypothetical protein